jgi:prepilin-type processing-associated H-X9-DG protein
MRSASRAERCRRRIMRRVVVGELEPFAPWVCSLIESFDPDACHAGGNVMFADGSVLVRTYKWRKGSDGQYHYLPTIVARRG